MPEEADHPITRRDLMDFAEEFDQRLAPRLQAMEDRLESRLMNRLDGRIDALEQRMLERVAELVRETETRLLRAFHDYATAIDGRLRRLEVSDSGTTDRLAVIERRLLRVERRLDLGPDEGRS